MQIEQGVVEGSDMQDDGPAAGTVERQFGWMHDDGTLTYTWTDEPFLAVNDTRDDVPAAMTVERRVIKLPIEIEEYIISFLENIDPSGYPSEEGLRAIARCPRVCRAWVPFSRFKLY